MFECTYFYFRRCHCRSCQSLCSLPVESASRVVSRPSFEHRAGYWELGTGGGGGELGDPGPSPSPSPSVLPGWLRLVDSAACFKII